jgi:hypothetical protein
MTMRERLDFLLLSAARRAYDCEVKKHLRSELRLGRFLASLLFNYPKLRAALFRLHGQALSEKVTSAPAGEHAYRKMVCNAFNYFKLLRFRNHKTREYPSSSQQSTLQGKRSSCSGESGSPLSEPRLERPIDSIAYHTTPGSFFILRFTLSAAKNSLLSANLLDGRLRLWHERSARRTRQQFI